MGTRGPAPKDPAERRRHNKKPGGEVVLPADVSSSVASSTTIPTKLPAHPGKAQWLPEVVRWFEAWRTTPAAATFCTTEWERLYRAAILAQAYWSLVALQDVPLDPDSKVNIHREIRQAHDALLAAEKGLPATDYERRRANVHTPKTPAASSPSAAPASTSQRRLHVVE